VVHLTGMNASPLAAANQYLLRALFRRLVSKGVFTVDELRDLFEDAAASALRDGPDEPGNQQTAALIRTFLSQMRDD
jgi:hypothetical protein